MGMGDTSLLGTHRSLPCRPAPSDASAFASILMAMDCHVCGSSLPEGARYCPSCGALVTGATATDERKMVTVLFADMVDSTGLSQRLDAERAREVLGRFYDVTVDELHALRGRPEKFIGDAVMAVFGLPQVHEDDALRAVRAGLAIRERVRRLCEELGLATPLEIRVGIESGEAATGTGPDGQLLVTGSVVNAAAIVREVAGIGDDDPVDVAVQRLRELVQRVCPPGPDARTVDRLQALLGLNEPRRDESAFVHDVRSGFLSLIEGLASERPVTLLFEDAQTLRPQMLDLIERIAARGRHGPGKVLILVATRTDLLEERPTWGTGAANQVCLRLEPLSDEEATELVLKAGGGRVGDDQASTITGRAGGNPFFIVESTGMLLRDRPATDGELLIPPTVQVMVAARLDGLPPEQRDLARRLSVYRYDFDLEEVSTVAQAGEEELQELIDAEIIVREEIAGSSPRWRFRHEVLRDVAYASLPKRERLRLHTVIAERL